MDAWRIRRGAQHPHCPHCPHCPSLLDTQQGGGGGDEEGDEGGDVDVEGATMRKDMRWETIG